MGKLVKILLGLVAVAVIIVAAVVWFVLGNLDAIVKEVVERVGTSVVGTSVTLDSASVSLKSGECGFDGLTVANPPGFTGSTAFELGTIDVALDLASLSGDVIVVEKVHGDAPALTYEVDGDGLSNLETLLRNIESGESESAAESPESETRLVIREFTMSNAELTLMHDRLDEPLTLSVPDVVLRDLGEQSSGATAAELARQLIEPVLTRAVDSAKQAAREALEAAVEERVEEEQGKLLEGLRERVEQD